MITILDIGYLDLMHLKALRLQTLSVLCNEEHSPDNIDKKRIHS